MELQDQLMLCYEVFKKMKTLILVVGVLSVWLSMDAYGREFLAPPLLLERENVKQGMRCPQIKQAAKPGLTEVVPVRSILHVRPLMLLKKAARLIRLKDGVRVRVTAESYDGKIRYPFPAFLDELDGYNRIHAKLAKFFMREDQAWRETLPHLFRLDFYFMNAKTPAEKDLIFFRRFLQDDLYDAEGRKIDVFFLEDEDFWGGINLRENSIRVLLGFQEYEPEPSPEPVREEDLFSSPRWQMIIEHYTPDYKELDRQVDSLETSI